MDGSGRETPKKLNEPVAAAALKDPFGRPITYIRVSVTDRCDFRCVYCMAENMTFLPRSDLLTLEELDRVCSAFVRQGTRKLRITGGEPLVRRNIMTLFRNLSRHLHSGALEELTLTTNGSQLAHFADALYDCGVRRINVSIDTLDPDRFRAITRIGDLDKVLAGLAAARRAGLAVKINTVALKGINDAELGHILAWCGDQGFDMTIIEVMPMGDIGGEDRLDQYLPLSTVRRGTCPSGGRSPTSITRAAAPPATSAVEETGRKLGFITPLTHNFCESCNRVRLTCTGTLFMCLGQDDAADLRAPIRASADDALLEEAIRAAIARKPKGHDFVIERGRHAPAVNRHMSVTGG